MREIKTTVYCDRCGKKIKECDYRSAIDVFAVSENCVEGNPIDLCKDCMISFHDWIKRREVIFS